jgi:hypothetical protein
VTATVDQTSGLLNITATDLDPERASLLADAFANQLLERLKAVDEEDTAVQIKDLQKQIRGLEKQIANLSSSRRSSTS